MNKDEMSLKYNQGILRRNHESNVKEKVVRALEKNVIAIVEMSNPKKKLEID